MRKEASMLTKLFYILLFGTPLLFTTNTRELFEFPKMFFVYFMGTLIISIFVLFRIWRSTQKSFVWPGVPILCFVAAYVLSTIFSSHPYTSVWGYYTRFNGGLVSVLVFFGIYIVAINELSLKDFEKLIVVALVSAIPVGVYAVAQHFSMIGNMWKANASLRVFSTFGQPNWLAAFFSMLLPIILFNFLVDKRYLKVLWGLLFLLGFSGLWFTYSISGLLGFVVALLCLFILNRTLVQKRLREVLILLSFAVLIAVCNRGIYASKVNDIYVDIKQQLSTRFIVSAQESPESLGVSPHAVSDPGYIRLSLWKGTLALIVSHPVNFLVGTGPETFPYAFQPFRPANLNYSSEWDFVFNKPHNYYLEIFSNLGLLGLVSYMMLIGFTFKNVDPKIFPSLVALYVTNIFGWPTVYTSLIFWMWLSYLTVKQRVQKV
jgi:putative inorganic carbon (HCO3(-)) transporter